MREAPPWMEACGPVPPAFDKGKAAIAFEHCLRAFRFRRLAKQLGVSAPSVDELSLPAGSLPGLNYEIPALRLSWENAVFFDTAKDEILDSAKPILGLAAEAMNRDVGDVHLYVVGHTDSRGSHGYNEALSERRARNALTELAIRGVPLEQMTYTSMGENQPIATNSTKEGRAANRRVEFMLAAYREANYKLVGNRVINSNWVDRKNIEKVKVAIKDTNYKILGVIPLKYTVRDEIELTPDVVEEIPLP